MFDTIIERNKEHPAIYHGKVLYKYGDYFTFGFRVNGKNYEWECGYDYWTLLEGE